MITFRVLGTLDLREEQDQLRTGVSGSKRLALLAYLVLAARGGLARRDTLFGLFWPEVEQDHARNALSNMLHQLRRSLGPGVLMTRGHAEVGVAPDALWCDAVAFQSALDHGRPADALELYQGDLLAGLFVSGASSEFDHWLEAERGRLRRLATDAARELAAEAERTGNTSDALRWARKACMLDPLDERAARRLIALLDSAGDRGGALRVYEELASRLSRQCNAESSAETRRVADAARERTARDDGQSTRVVAVLPFANLSGSPDAEPFVAGLHDDLLTELSRISALRVIARTSVLRYRDSAKPVPELARELSAGTIVEGAVQIAGDRLRLNVQVLDGATGAHRWATRFDRALSAQNMFDLQVELAERIAAALRAELTPAERRRTGREPTSDLDAYRLHAQGRAYLDQRTRAGMQRALDFFERAVARDPRYALAWAGLADALSLHIDYGYEPAEQVMPRAREAVERALELDPNLAEAHTSLGEYEIINRDGPAAVAALRRAVAIRDGYAEAHNWLGWISQVLGDRVQAMASARRASALDPLSPEVISNLALSYLTHGDYETALREARRTEELQPDWTSGPFYAGLALYHLGRNTEAIEVLRGLTVEWAGSGPALTEALACVAAGAHDRAAALLDDFERSDDAYAAGVVRLAMGQREPAFEALRRVRRWDYWPTLSLHHCYPDVLAPVRSDPLGESLYREMARAWGVA